MGVGSKVLMGLRVIALVAALAVVGLGAWSKFIIHDVEIRGTSVLSQLQPKPNDADIWRVFFDAVANGTTRVWISIASASIAFLTGLLLILSFALRRLEMPASVRVPLELLFMSAMAVAFGCLLSLAINLNAFGITRLETSGSADLTTFAMIIPLSRALVVTAGSGCIILLGTTITSMVQACMRMRSKESCSFEPTASALGMGYGYNALVPPVARSRPPTIYDPRKPMPNTLERMPETDEEKALVEPIAGSRRVDSGISQSDDEHIDFEKEETWPLNPKKSERVAPIRPARPWSEVPK
ncbi:hypothetical protein FB567DRAFT_272314 [Paraphoma chrysanthemicola]|uniref:Uncharacterized protein n=1 Tax=Paraphoma chrysanthemicola TaxID=798071 RepID=A0A8K0W181_9PLEO|nr:hypothetical protein FB567DRAFT_272314 [Paraphoma chrysanthemicola]